jgi:L-ribulokinase
MAIVAGVDFGTSSVRVSIVHDERGPIGAGISDCPVIRARDNPNYAAQRHQDHLYALTAAFQQALASSGVDGSEVQALAVDTTGSSVVIVDERFQPLDDYYLWCDHRAWREAAEITQKARQIGLEALEWCGGVYSSEWGFAKLLHWLRNNPATRPKFYTAFEHCDLIVASLCGCRSLEETPRSICAMGHKWMWNERLGGLPPEEFLSDVDPLLKGVRDKLSGRFGHSREIAGYLTPDWASRLHLKPGIPIPIGGLDAHWDAIGAGCRIGDVVNVIGTSTCMMALSKTPKLIPGVSGIVPGSIHPEMLGIEAGLSATGDLFDAISRRAGMNVDNLTAKLAGYRAGQTGLLRIAWDNGDRCVLGDAALSGVALGWRLSHTAEDELFAAIEGTAFHTRIILERLQEFGVPVSRVINGGGIPQKNAVLNRVYASVIQKPVLIPAKTVTSLGSAIFAFLAAGVFKTVEEAQDALCPGFRVAEIDPQDVKVYDDLFGYFRDMYFNLSSSGVFAVLQNAHVPGSRLHPPPVESVETRASFPNTQSRLGF